MNARAEAHQRLEGRYETRVLEPSPPTGAELSYAVLHDATDQRDTALAFFRARLNALVR